MYGHGEAMLTWQLLLRRDELYCEYPDHPKRRERMGLPKGMASELNSEARERASRWKLQDRYSKHRTHYVQIQGNERPRRPAQKSSSETENWKQFSRTREDRMRGWEMNLERWAEARWGGTLWKSLKTVQFISWWRRSQLKISGRKVTRLGLTER